MKKSGRQFLIPRRFALRHKLQQLIFQKKQATNSHRHFERAGNGLEYQRLAAQREIPRRLSGVSRSSLMSIVTVVPRRCASITTGNKQPSSFRASQRGLRISEACGAARNPLPIIRFSKSSCTKFMKIRSSNLVASVKHQRYPIALGQPPALNSIVPNLLEGPSLAAPLISVGLI